MKISSEFITYKGINLYVEFEYSRGYPETRETPEEKPDFEILSVQVEGVYITNLLHDEDFVKIEEILINTYEDE